jgi:hypothetical protein
VEASLGGADAALGSCVLNGKIEDVVPVGSPRLLASPGNLRLKQAILEPALTNEEVDVAFFPTMYAPGSSSGLVLNGSRNSSVTSNFGNDSDTSSAYGESQDRQQYSRSNSKNRFFPTTDLGFSQLFKFGK